MKRRGAARVYRQTRGMTVAQQVAYWKKRTAALKRRQAKSRPR
jgi:hypothetical protein